MKRNVKSLVLATCLFSTVAWAAASGPGYWIWAGIRYRPLPGASALYVHQGCLGRRAGRTVLVRQGLSPFPIAAPEIYLVFRLDALGMPGELVSGAEILAARWQDHGVRVAGIQLDFDSATAKLGSYADYLADVRHRLSPRYQLSVTGLADWASTGEPRDLERLSTLVDEAVFQLYRGRRPIARWRDYLRRLGAVSFPFKVGLLESMPVPRELFTNHFFRGPVYFLEKTK